MSFTFQTYTGTWGGFSSNPTGLTSRYAVEGKLMFLYVYVTGNGTSNATTLTYTLPSGYTAKNKMSFPVAAALNGGVAAPDAQGQTNAGSATIDFYTTATGAAWSNSGNKRVAFSVVIEIE